MKFLVTMSAVAVTAMAAPVFADTNVGPSTSQPSVPTPSSPQTPGTTPQDPDGGFVNRNSPPTEGANSRATNGDSAGTTGISGPYNPTPPVTNPGATPQ
jgi:hypothetical protein